MLLPGDGNAVVVTPFAGVWIEISHVSPCITLNRSLPSRECGLKYVIALHERKFFIVTPFAGVWIEIDVTEIPRPDNASLPSRECGLKCAAHHPSSAWTCHSLRGSVDWNSWRKSQGSKKTPSLPSRECGLKFLLLCYIISNFCVTPFAGVWIEIIELRMSLENGSSITNIK